MECISSTARLIAHCSENLRVLYVTDETVCYYEVDQSFIIILLHLGPVQVMLCVRVQALCCCFQQLQALSLLSFLIIFMKNNSPLYARP